MFHKLSVIPLCGYWKQFSKLHRPVLFLMSGTAWHSMVWHIKNRTHAVTHTYTYTSACKVSLRLYFKCYFSLWLMDKELNEQHYCKPVSSFYRYRSWDSRSQSAGSSSVFHFILLILSLCAYQSMSAKPINRNTEYTLWLTFKKPKLIRNSYLKFLNSKNFIWNKTYFFFFKFNCYMGQK